MVAQIPIKIGSRCAAFTYFSTIKKKLVCKQKIKNETKYSVKNRDPF